MKISLTRLGATCLVGVVGAMPLVVSVSVDASVNVADGSCSSGSYTESTDGGDTIGIFRSSAQLSSSSGCTWRVPSGVNSVRVLVVAGGGGAGGYHTSGGGGAGGLIHEVGYEVTPGENINVTVGGGGAPGSITWNTLLNPGSNGEDSRFGTLIAKGGGGGGGGGTNSQVGNPGLSGGSGGGGGRCWVQCNTSHTTANQNFRAGGSGTSGQGHAGGKTHFMAAAGGGGAGERGGDGDANLVAGAGGDGLQIDITGTDTWYAGGGAGGTEANVERTPGGRGGGGAGATGRTSPQSFVFGVDAEPHTGGGGGGMNWGGGGNGGSGIVIVRWGSAPSAPSFSVSQSSSWVEVNSSAASLYTVTNTGASISRFSVSPALPDGVTLNTSTGEVSGSPTATQAQTTYTLTAHRISSSNGGVSQSSKTFKLGVYSGTIPAPDPDPSSENQQQASTNSEGNSSTNANSGTSSGTSESQQLLSSVSTRQSATTTPRVSTNVNATTTVPAPTTTTTTIPVPTAPNVSTGEAGALVDGEAVDTTLTRNNNALVVSGAGIEASVYGLTNAGVRVDLDADGYLRLQTSDQIVVEAEGFSPGDEVDVWMYSTPTRLGTIAVDANGITKGTFTLPAGVDKGDHRVVLDGQNRRGQDVILGIGIAVGTPTTTSLLSRLLIIVPVSIAILAALIIPTRLRRRREEQYA